MKFDINGRIDNLRVPSNRTGLSYSIYEAVSNAVHAIEERFGMSEFAKRGVITVSIDFDKDKNLKHVAVSDNGVGLNEKHLKSFETCDTREKENIGGRGVGRLIWAKVFREIVVRSTYEVGLDRCEEVRFSFNPRLEDSLVDIKRLPGKVEDVGTQIVLGAIRPDQNAAIGKGPLTRLLCHHFFPMFIAGGMPKLVAAIGPAPRDIGAYLAERVEKKHEQKQTLDFNGIGELEITHVYAEKNISQGFSNAILLAAQGRVVETIEIGQKFALSGLENGKAYVCVVRGKFLDANVDQERTSFKASQAELSAIHEAALEAAEAFLEPHIKTLRKGQKRIVVDLLQEHPQLAVSVDDIDAYVEKLTPGMSDEDIGKSLFTVLYRHEKKVKADITSISADASASEGRQGQIDKLVQKVSEDAKRRLAEYTIKRHQIIQLARSLLRYSDEEKKSYHWEKTLHEIICPMGKMLSSKDYDDHNLWLVDDLLSYYSFFASDKAMSAFGVDGERKEPDLIFLNPYGFRREGTNDPVVVVEFKRPGDEQLSSDPVDQVLEYVEKLRTKTVRDQNGEVVSEIGEDTPFECIILCDLTEGARKRFKRSLAQNPTPDGLGYYGFSPNHRASLRVLSYKKVFRDAELRNQSFFQKLGLLPEEVRNALAAATEVVTEAAE
ncbi:ATP-binding protein [Rhizobium sp. CBK13]|uniref:ATP-binding protein n=1 Tax=Rhizobium sp. CBK13 TaxID=3031399 RepID=UPI0023B19BD5|nr:ATP-binding protein [Rhizobium sp. CBK13]MDE8761816.1 ATP-binding protein [Rhizobium sp. CBK13]